MLERWPSGLRPRSRKAVSCQKRDRGFESHPLRHCAASKEIDIIPNFAERCPSWLKEHDWKSCVLSKAAPRVRIPLSPPIHPRMSRVAFAHLPDAHPDSHQQMRDPAKRGAGRFGAFRPDGIPDTPAPRSGATGSR